MSVLDKLYNKIECELDSNISDSTIVRIVQECLYRTTWQGWDIEDLLSDDVSITFNEDTSEIDIRQNVMFGIFWSFDSKTGELVGT